jgi:hypothetical protein
LIEAVTHRGGNDLDVVALILQRRSKCLGELANEMNTYADDLPAPVEKLDVTDVTFIGRSTGGEVPGT